MAWDEKLLSDINNALKQQGKLGSAPASAQPAQKKPMDMSAIEASIQASIRGSKPQDQTPPPVTPAPAPAQPAEKKSMDMSAVEAAIQASVQGGKKSEPAPEAVVSEVMPKTVPQPETPRPAKGEIVLEPIRDEEPAPDSTPDQPSKADPEAELIAIRPGAEGKQTDAPEEPEDEEIPMEMPVIEPEVPVEEPEPEVTQEEIARMAFAHEPLDVGSREAAQMFLEAAGRIPGYLAGMRVEDAIVRADAQLLESSVRDADTDTLLVLFKFLSVEIEYARDESTVTGLQSLVLDVLHQRLNGQ